MSSRSRLYTGFLAVAFAVAGHAATILTLTPVTINHQYQQTTNSPCVIGDSSCQGSLPYTLLPPNVSSYDFTNATSPGYAPATLMAIVGNSFAIGVDVNQTVANQTFSAFEMLVNGIVVSSYQGGTVEVPPTVGGGNGNGYADYLLTGFVSLAGLNANDVITFRTAMPLVNDGREEFFLLQGAAVPEPISVVLTGSGLLGLFLLRKRFANR